MNLQSQILPETVSMEDGLAECYDWYQHRIEEIYRKNYIEYIEQYLTNGK